jgi:hypothetical protein
MRRNQRQAANAPHRTSMYDRAVALKEEEIPLSLPYRVTDTDAGLASSASGGGRDPRTAHHEPTRIREAAGRIDVMFDTLKTNSAQG